MTDDLDAKIAEFKKEPLQGELAVKLAQLGDDQDPGYKAIEAVIYVARGGKHTPAVRGRNWWTAGILSKETSPESWEYDAEDQLVAIQALGSTEGTHRIGKAQACIAKLLHKEQVEVTKKERILRRPPVGDDMITIRKGYTRTEYPYAGPLAEKLWYISDPPNMKDYTFIMTPHQALAQAAQALKHAVGH